MDARSYQVMFKNGHLLSINMVGSEETTDNYWVLNKFNGETVTIRQSEIIYILKSEDYKVEFVNGKWVEAKSL